MLKWQVAVLVLGAVTLLAFGAGVVVGDTKHHEGRGTVGLYGCTADLSTCTRLDWTPGIDQCRAAAHEFETAPVVGPSLVCIRRAAFVTE